MTTLTVEVPDEIEKTLSDLVRQLGGTVLAVDNDGKLGKKAEVLNDLQNAVDFVNLHKQGKTTAKTMDKLMDEL